MDYSIAIGLQLFDNFSRQLFTAKENFSKFSQDVEKTQKGLAKFGETMKKAFDVKAIREASEKVEDFSVKIAQATALPLAGMSKALKNFSEMENSRVEMEVAFMTKSGLPEEMEKINSVVGELGVKLPGSATDFYRVATALKSTGMSAKDVAEGALKGASYAWVLFKREVSPEQAAEYMQEFANAFKIPSNQFMDFVDQLQRVKFASGLSLSEIAYSTKYFSSELNQLGFTGLNAFKFMGSWIGTLRQFGLKGETAGTSIRSLLQNILNLEDNVKKLSKKGIDLKISAKDFVDEKGAFKLEQFLMTVRDKLSQIHDPLQKMEAMKTLFDGEGMRAIAPLLAKTKDEAVAYLDSIKESLSPDEYEKIKKQISEGGFSGLEDMAKRMQDQASLQDRINKTLDTFANIWESLQGTFSQFGAVIGELVAPSLKSLMDMLNNAVSKLSDFVGEHKSVAKVLAYTVGGFVGLLAVFGAVGVVIGSVMKLFAFAFSPFAWIARIGFVRSLTSALLQNILAFIRWAAAGITSSGWLKSLDFFLLRAKLSMLQLIGVIRMKIIALRAMAIAWITSPIGLIITGITALIAISYLLYRNWDKISKALVTAWNWLKANWQKVLQTFLWINPITMPIMALNKLVRYVFGINLFDAGKKIIESIWSGMKSVASKPVEAIKSVVKKIRNFLPFSPAKEGPLSDINKIKLIETIAENIKPIPVVSAMRNALEPVKTFAQPLQPTIGAGVSVVVNLGGINISGAAKEKEANQIALTLEKEIRTVLEKIANERFRRQY